MVGDLVEPWKCPNMIFCILSEIAKKMQEPIILTCYLQEGGCCFWECLELIKLAEQPEPTSKVMTDDVTNPASWHWAKKFAFRFFFVYLLLYCFPFPLDSFDFIKPIARPYYQFLDWLIPAVGNRWFHIHAVPRFDMFDKFDDSGYGLVFIYLNLVGSLFAALIWSFIDRNSKNYDTANQWLRLYLRFFLAAFLFGYGFNKWFPSQFQPITASRLTMTVGDQSPMLVAWNFMGYSVTMMKINGAIELLAAVLLIFRRTATLGAIISAGIFGFVVLMDFSFNVPVRLLASHLLFISILLALQDAERLVNVLVFNRATTPAVYAPLILHPLGRKIFNGVLGLLAVCLLYTSMINGLNAQKEFGYYIEKPPLYGVYRTVYFLRNTDTIPPLGTDRLRWKQLVIDGTSFEQSAKIEFSNDKTFLCMVKADTTNHILHLKLENDNSRFQYSFPDSNHILIRGRWKEDSIEVFMNKFDLNNYLLHREQFKWINQ